MPLSHPLVTITNKICIFRGGSKKLAVTPFPRGWWGSVAEVPTHRIKRWNVLENIWLFGFFFLVREGVSLWNASSSWYWNACFGLAASKREDRMAHLGDSCSWLQSKASWGRSLLWVDLPTSSPHKGGSTLQAELGRCAYSNSSEGCKSEGRQRVSSCPHVSGPIRRQWPVICLWKPRNVQNSTQPASSPWLLVSWLCRH